MSDDDAPALARIRWCLRLRARPAHVFDLLSTDVGRTSFWAERTEQRGDRLTFYFPNGEVLESRILESRPPEQFVLSYFGGSRVCFTLREADDGTDLRLEESGLPSGSVEENRAGWVSVLMNLKAQADHGVDLRNHAPECTWDAGYVDN